ncbi:MAG TPA: aspartate dehydrogenase [Geminicoccaceae bacterium]
MREATVAMAGFGAIGGEVARCLDRGGIPGLRLAAVSARDQAKAEAKLRNFRHAVPVVGLAELPAHGEIVVECVPAAAFRDAAGPALEAGRVLITVSGGALLGNMDLVELAKRTGGRIIVATGALLGLDAVRAAAEGRIERVTMITRKPPGGLAGAPYLEEHGISLDGLGEAKKVFEGSARDGALGFPANVNVAAALSLAGVGPDRTTLEIWADPKLSRNTHQIVVEADSARFEMSIENVPSEANPRTGKLTPLSVIATLRSLVQPLKVGT